MGKKGKIAIVTILSLSAVIAILVINGIGENRSRVDFRMAVDGVLSYEPGSAGTIPELPPRNPYLADSIYSMGHVDSAQQDSFTVAGPVDVSRKLEENEINFHHIGPAHFGIAYSSPYSDGSRVAWTNGVDRIVKLNHETFEVIDEFFFPDKKRYTEDLANESYDNMDRLKGIPAIVNAFQTAAMLKDLSGVYTLLDKDGRYYISGKRAIEVYGDSEPGNPRSPITKLASYNLPAEIDGALVGMNMTYDGWIILATEHGYMISVNRELTEARWLRLPYAELGGDIVERVGYGWIRNGFAIDDDGGIYIASRDHMHKVIWTGDQLSSDPADGAWSEPYRNSTGSGTGATPSLMGFGEEDQFVVITDGDVVMNMVLFWRDEIPSDWEQLEGAPSRRIAGQLPVTMGDEDIEKIQSEQSVVVSGYGALVVNNEPNVPEWVPPRAKGLFAGFLGNKPVYQPFGMQKFRWDPDQKKLLRAWANPYISSPNCVPAVSRDSGFVYTLGARNGEWTLEAINWNSGQSVFHYIVGGGKYNSLYSGILLDEMGHIIYGTSYGKVRLEPTRQKS